MADFGSHPDHESIFNNRPRTVSEFLDHHSYVGYIPADQRHLTALSDRLAQIMKGKKGILLAEEQQPKRRVVSQKPIILNFGVEEEGENDELFRRRVFDLTNGFDGKLTMLEPTTEQGKVVQSTTLEITFADATPIHIVHYPLQTTIDQEVLRRMTSTPQKPQNPFTILQRTDKK